MTPEEAIKGLKSIFSEHELDLPCTDSVNVESMAIKALEKQIPKKPIRSGLCTCPSCGTYNEVITKRRNTVAHDIVFCWHCGQSIEVDRLESEKEVRNKAIDDFVALANKKANENLFREYGFATLRPIDVGEIAEQLKGE